MNGNPIARDDQLWAVSDVSSLASSRCAAGGHAWFAPPSTGPYIEEEWLEDLVRPIMEPIMGMTAPGNVADTQVKEDYGKYASAERLCGKEPKDR